MAACRRRQAAATEQRLGSSRRRVRSGWRLGRRAKQGRWVSAPALRDFGASTVISISSRWGVAQMLRRASRHALLPREIGFTYQPVGRQTKDCAELSDIRFWGGKSLQRPCRPRNIHITYNIRTRSRGSIWANSLQVGPFRAKSGTNWPEDNSSRIQRKAPKESAEPKPKESVRLSRNRSQLRRLWANRGPNQAQFGRRLAPSSCQIIRSLTTWGSDSAKFGM